MPVVVTAEPPVPLSEFAKLPLYSGLKISPTGQYLAASVRNDKNESSIVIMDLVSRKITAIAYVYGDDFISEFIWANDERVVGWVAKKYGSHDQPFLTGDMVALNWDGSKKELIYGVYKEQSALYDSADLVAELLHKLPDDKRRILLQTRNPRADQGSYTKAIKLDIYSGRENKVLTAPMKNANLLADNDGNVRISVAEDPNNENAVTVHKRVGKKWELLGQFHGKEGSITPVAFTPDNKQVYMLDNRDTDTDSLYLYNLETNEKQLLYQHDVVDIEDVEIAPDNRVIGVYTEPDFPDYTTLDFDHPVSHWFLEVRQALSGFRVKPTSITSDGTKAIIRADSDRMPPAYYMFDTETNQLAEIVRALPGINPQLMRPVEAYKLQTRDDATIYAYLTRPDDSEGPFPMVVMPHGGPHGVRDYWSYDAYAQMMASRGYAVLQVNYRGSGGYGRDFLYIGYGKWGTLMQDDVTDATLWAIQEGITEDNRICIFGGSYGGYAAMMGAVREPDLYQCVIAYVGVYDLELMFKKGDIPTRESGLVYMRQAVGEDKDDLRARSPIHNLDKVKAPVFIVHGEKDFRVDIEHAHRLRKGLKKLGKPYEWLVKPREGHGFYNPENRLELFEKMLSFLERYIGPGYEPGPAVAREN